MIEMAQMTKDTPMLNGIRAAILDMDGVLWRENQPLPGLVPFFDFLRQAAIPFVLATNNSGKSVTAYVEKLAGMGVAATPEYILSSGVATAAYLRATYPDNNLRIHVLGGDGLRAVIREAGYEPVATDAEVVVVGFDGDLTYNKLRQATYLIRAGARFIATNGDRTFPTPEGLAPGAGSLVAALQASTDQEPLVIGKPEPTMFEMALQRLGTRGEQTLMIGDRLETDILGGQNAETHTALMMTGVTTPELLEASNIQPDLVFDDLDHLREAWIAARQVSEA